ncbi:hypothetical protein V1514DRAFT_327386 [Lipomyces japonicus]|uniref:uncharacterized protein n=1 Tax=Lipomyces japonicus TaxID=56871 RepID=UPI0034CEFFCB
MQRPSLQLRVSLDLSCINLPCDTRPPLNKEDGATVEIFGNVIAFYDALEESYLNATLPPFNIRELEVRFTSRALLVSSSWDNCAVPDLYSKKVVVFSESNKTSIPEALCNGPLFTSFKVPFKIQVPAWLPPTINSSHTKVVHSIQARLKYSSPRSAFSFFLGPQSTVKSFREIKICLSGPSNVSSSVIRTFTSSKEKKDDFYWKVQAPHYSAKNSHVQLYLRFSILPSTVQAYLAAHSVHIDLVQERVKIHNIDAQSPWEAVAHNGESFASFALSKDAKKSLERTEDITMSPFVVSFPNPPPHFSADNGSSTEIRYATQICLSLRDCKKLLPSCNTPYLKVKHKIRIMVYLTNANLKAQEVYTICVPVVITNPDDANLSNGLPLADQENDSFAELLSDNSSEDRGDIDHLPSYEDAVYQNQLIYVFGPITKQVVVGRPQDEDTNLPISN